MKVPSKCCLVVRALIVCVLAVALGPPAALADGPAPKPAQRRFEIRFLEDMIDHHGMAVMMAEMCLVKAHHDDLTDLCEDIIAAQTAEIEQMQKWLKDWYGRQHEPEMTRRMERQMEQLEELEGDEFEIEFMQMMIAHHEAAITEAQECLRRAYHRKLERLCRDIIESQSAEIEQMEEWLCEWYDICKHHRGRH